MREAVRTGKKTDRVFHLTVTALALTLTAVSVGTLAYQHDPNVFRKWLGPYATLNKQPTPGQTDINTSPSPAGTTSTRNHATGSQTPTKPPVTSTSQSNASAAKDLALMPTYEMTDNGILVTVKAGGSDVTAADIQKINTLMSTYHIVETVSKTLRMNIYQQVYVIICKSQSDYQTQLSKLGVNSEDAKRYTMDTGGFTQGDTVVIPLYQNQANADLTNSLTHELTHAFLNLNVGSFPSWMNEGLAVMDGMDAQSFAESSVAYQGYVRQMAENVIDAAKSNNLWPLEPDEQKVLSGSAPYDLELQDWLAVRYLIQLHGLKSLEQYFYRLKLGESKTTAFQRSFGESESAFNTDVTNHLNALVDSSQDGVQLTFNVPSSFKGDIRILQHGTQDWSGFRPTAGVAEATVSPVGVLTTSATKVAAIQDSSPPDNVTLYVNLDPDTPFTYQGKQVQNAGFAIDYHYGLYSFVNAWVTFENGKSQYIDQPNLFGVQLTKIQETQTDSWLTNLLTPPSELNGQA